MTKTSKTTLTSGANDRPPVVFFGSGPVAAKSLELLIKHQPIEAVITKPTTVKQMTAVAKGACVYSVSSRAELDDLILSQPFDTTLGVLIDFGIIVSQDVIDSFKHGIINSHFSLLPEWRGADPITFSILSGQNRTGVSLMLLVEAMDEGPIISIGTQDLNGTETTPELTEKLIRLSDALLKEQIPRYLARNKSIPQEQIPSLIPEYPSSPTYSRKLTKQDSILDFTKPADQLEREVRAFLEWPKSHATIAGKTIIVLEADVDASATGKPGDIFRTKDKKIGIYCSAGALLVTRLKPEGKQAMTSEGFLAGYGKDIPLKD